MASTDFVLLLGEEKIMAPKEFISSCITFTSMFEDTEEMNNSYPIPITDKFSVEEVSQYIKLFMDLYELKVSNDAKVEMSYLEYISDFREEYIKNYTDNNFDPPHCRRLFDIYKELGEENLEKILIIDGFFNNLHLRRGIMLLIAAFVKKGKEDEVDKIISSIIEVLQNDFNSQ